MVNFIHIADLHANKIRLNECISALTKIKDFISQKEQKPILLISGDFWDSTITNTDAFAKYVKAVKEILDLTQVFFIYGTAGHEPAKSLEVFKELGAKVYDKLTFEKFNNFELIAIPEPRRVDYSISKDIDKKIFDDMNNFCNNLLSKELPRIVMFHGEIIGETYHNGMLCSSKLGLSKELLKNLDADYIACGHIHNAYKVSGIKNCYYAGSIPPKNFDEYHNAQWNYIEIDNNEVKVEHIDAGFPQNLIEEIKYENIDNLKKFDWTNKNVHLKITLDKAMKRNFNPYKIKEELLEKTHANSIKLSFNYISISNIRSEEISKSKTCVEKFKIWTDLNDVNYNNSCITKIENIETNIIENQFVPNDTFELMSLSLKGAIGLKDGSGLEELNIDFTDYQNGILAIIGPTGSGKSTIIENCHPYPCMLTRQGSLKEHFCLKDAHRILVYKTSSGKYIQIKMLIDGLAKSVGNRYFVSYKNSENEEWKPYTSCSGSYDDYVNWVNNTFGPIEIFLRTSFYAKEQIKGVPDLSRATKTEKMELFSTLAGTDYLSFIANQAKLLNKETQDNITKIKGQIKDYDQVKTNIEEYKNIIEENNQTIKTLSELLENDKKDLEYYGVEQSKFLAVSGTLATLHQTIAAQTKVKENLENRLTNLALEIKDISEIVENIEIYKQQNNWYEENSTLKLQLKEKLTKYQDDIFILQKKSVDFDKVLDSLNSTNRELSITISKKELKIENLKTSISNISDKCPVCGADLSEHKKAELEEEIKTVTKEIKSLEKELSDLNKQLDENNDKIKLYNKDELRNQIIDIQNKVFEVNNDIDSIDGYMATIDINKMKYAITDAEQDYQMKLFEEKDVQVQLERAKAELKQSEDLDKSQPVDYSDKIKRLERGILDSSQKIAECNAEIKVAKKQLDALLVYEKQISEIEEKLKSYNQDIKDYNIIEKAFSNNGIIALELDSAAPEISQIANSILQETYGDRFSITFETQRNTTTGKCIDDFIINVFDADSGRIKKLENLSSGETVWIKQTLYYAFSVLRSRRTGFCFRTRFLDESDSSLDSMARVKYIKMIEAAHSACNASLTVMITHSQEIKDIVEQKFELTGKN